MPLHSVRGVDTVDTVIKTPSRMQFVLRRDAGVDLEAMPVNVTLQAVIRKLFPELAAQREREAEAERLQWSSKVPLFCLDKPFFPNQVRRNCGKGCTCVI
jgi:hypothetical protein